ncbi:hypothetical protein K440DRAFT_619320 [Wilcoxina mikolae CBS 423.85]|nr:hypothetical protein K440DRAFT_619320 [Wilcoxina mikolae CBS 423.85]
MVGSVLPDRSRILTSGDLAMSASSPPSLSAEAAVRLCELLASLQGQLNAAKFPTMLGSVRRVDIENLSDVTRVSLRNGIYNAFNTFLQDSVKPGGQNLAPGTTIWMTTKTLSDTLLRVFNSAGIADALTWKPADHKSQILNPALPMLARIDATVCCIRGSIQPEEIIATGKAVLEYLDDRK